VCPLSTQAVELSGHGQPGGAFDIKVPRVLVETKPRPGPLKPPFEATPEILIKQAMTRS
jgi:hypothetical protein